MEINNWIINNKSDEFDTFLISYEEIKEKISTDYIENIGNDNARIIVYDIFQFHFLEQKLLFITVSIDKSSTLFLRVGEQKFLLSDLNLEKLIQVFNELNIGWEFNQDYCFLKQIDFDSCKDGKITKLGYNPLG